MTDEQQRELRKMNAEHALKCGEQYPYDAPDAWWHSSSGDGRPPATDWAHAAARGVIADLNERRGIKIGFRSIDESVRAEIIQSLADIIRAAAPVERGE
jgi:hypothetical protein